ncbi:uncharacterized protein LOC110830118 [Zootermopsis nevadensis]|uniref:Chitin-binding type-2 domain-containing protein n=1 Tax=Zootermopsis nevadensis TaxID=136037 RepID=A0A067RIU6_ZOONE|nr:uncharacterized protein LOC110830118 [Zootermopsis nevadensis]KDR19208.1 hypothetical protein L798_06263 [Zootermopsis nevadensis]
MWTQSFVKIFFTLSFYMATASSQDAGFKCKAAGFFADPTDCHRFYNCDDDLDVIRGTCTKYGHFDPVDTCVWGDCTNAYAPITTPNTTQQTAATTSSTPTTSTFKCPGSGKYPDPSDTRSYYVCDSKMIPKRKTCFILHKFDPKRSACILFIF